MDCAVFCTLAAKSELVSYWTAQAYHVLVQYYSNSTTLHTASAALAAQYIALYYNLTSSGS